MSNLSRDEEKALIDLEFTELRDNEHSDSDGYSTCLASTQNDDRCDDDDDDDDDEKDDNSSLSQEEEEEERSSSISSSGDDEPLHVQLFGHISKLRRRGAFAPMHNIERNDDGAHSSDDSKNRPKRQLSNSREYGLCRLANALLCSSFMLWLIVAWISMSSSPSQYGARPLKILNNRSFLQKLYDHLFARRPPRLTTGQIAQLRKQRTDEARLALGSAAQGTGFFNFFGLRRKAPPKRETDEVPPGCEFGGWQVSSYPNCNDVHEIDLEDVIFSSIHQPQSTQNATLTKSRSKLANRVGFVDSGLWRMVWKVDPRQEQTEEAPAVLKMMKGEHDVDKRNLDRHRRDALVMERLTSSPYIVSIYAFCANSAVTEYLSTSLEAVIAQDESVLQLPTRHTPEGRLRLALGVAKGIEAVHEMEGGPIIHADIVTKQFLLDKNGTMKLNDFNRCRFMPRNNETGKFCEVRIPTAPGTSRSPEEYHNKALTEKVDVYSGANVMYEILTGEEPWLKQQTLKAQERIQNGEKPPLAEQYWMPNSSDAGLAALIDWAYEIDPVHRINASDLVRELEELTQHFTS